MRRDEYMTYAGKCSTAINNDNLLKDSVDKVKIADNRTINTTIFCKSIVSLIFCNLVLYYDLRTCTINGLLISQIRILKNQKIY